jgi:large subunit ribosomal protein L9
MKIILIEDIRGLGRKGDIVEVSDGYAKNYLIPKGVAVVATKEAISKLERNRQKEEELKKENYKLAQSTKDKIESIEMLKILPSKNGGVFGSVRKEDIVEFLLENGIKVSKENIILERPIKKEGEYVVSILLFPGTQGFEEVKANLKLKITLSQQH